MDPSSTIIGLGKAPFRTVTLIELAVLNSYFIFDGKPYQQTEGLGLPLGSTFANIFLCFKEKLWLDSCPELFKPTLYKRYVDDTFLLFKDVSQAHLFLTYLNSQHPNIKFSMECESDNRLNFLDCSVYKDCNKFHTYVFRKKNFTGLGTSFLAFVPLVSKLIF